ncbi:MAG TPA: Lrp/AsnC family transcriptional regulator [Armatimonadetes bacterium]|nr:Lrp/AsnC family transcriptional regulator [Armatimonadota bacterium]
MAVRAYVLVKISGPEAERIRRQVRKVQGVRRADLVTGPYDLIATVEVEDFKALVESVLSGIRAVEGVVDTLTCVAVTR